MMNSKKNIIAPCVLWFTGLSGAGKTIYCFSSALIRYDYYKFFKET